MRREFPVGPHDDGRLLEPQGRDPVHHRRDPQARGFPPGTLSWVLTLGALDSRPKEREVGCKWHPRERPGGPRPRESTMMIIGGVRAREDNTHRTICPWGPRSPGHYVTSGSHHRPLPSGPLTTNLSVGGRGCSRPRGRHVTPGTKLKDLRLSHLSDQPNN